MLKSELSKEGLINFVLTGEAKILAASKGLMMPASAFYLSFLDGSGYRLNARSAKTAIKALNNMNLPAGVSIARGYSSATIGGKKMAVVATEMIKYEV